MHAGAQTSTPKGPQISTQQILLNHVTTDRTLTKQTQPKN